MESSRELIVSFRSDAEGNSRFRSVPAPDSTLDTFANILLATGLAEAAFIKAAASLPRQDIEYGPPSQLIDVTASLRNLQGHLDAAPGGVQTSALAGVAGAKGKGVRVFDAESDWETGHQDRPATFLNVVFGPVTAAPGADQHHGTAVIGVVAARDDSVGVTGIAPDATLGLVRFNPNFLGTAATIRDAVDKLTMTAGDILILPVDRTGPRGKKIAIEWWPDDFDAIKYATDRGVTVVEAAGNGNEDLDHADYNTPLTGFGATWSNPFQRASAAFDSGAILVGAGVPPGGTHPDRSRDPDSNFGSAVDVQGWGSRIFTTGYGDQTQGSDTKKFYTAYFGKTSGATAIVAGVLACVQGTRIAAGKKPWTPSEARKALHTTGSPQQASNAHPLNERIGNRPNLAELITLALT